MSKVRTLTFDKRLNAKLAGLRPAERRVARFVQERPEEALIGSAAAIAESTNTSDATVIRTAKALGYASLDDLRRDVAARLRSDLSPAARMTRTLSELRGDAHHVLEATLAIHIAALEALRRDISPDRFDRVVASIVDAERMFVFGIGPSSAMANYFTLQLGRLGFEAAGLTHTGLLLADGIKQLRKGDLLAILAYGHLYAEVDALLERASKLQLPTILFTDSLEDELGPRVDIVLKVARGRTDMMSLHTATLGLIEALLVGVAARRPEKSLASLKDLDELRARLSSRQMRLRRR